MCTVLKACRFNAFWISATIAAALLAGCNKPAPETEKKPNTTSADAAGESNAAPVVATADPHEGEKICFACKGEGTIKCLAPGCQDGMVECPGPCLKLTRGVWVHLDVPGHAPTDVWQKFYLPDGSYTAYNQGHIGHVIALQNGQAVDTGPCKLCGGTGKVPCSVCKGTGKQVCLICKGRKYIPATWTPTDNPWLNSQPDLIRLASGKLVFGRIIFTNVDDFTVKTRDGKFMHIQMSDILPNPPVNSTNAPM